MDYSDQTAQAYDAYRPPLHEVILEQLLGNVHVDHALDVGSGTGTSTTVLLPYATHVTGLEPSKSMIDRCEDFPSIEYIEGSLPFARLRSNLFGLITFAGSINYCHTQQVFDDAVRLLLPKGLIVVYDFRLPLAEMLGINMPSSSYKHALNWSEFAPGTLHEIKSLQSVHALTCTKEEFISLCEAEEGVKDVLPEGWKNALHSSIQLNAELFGTVYGALPG